MSDEKIIVPGAVLAPGTTTGTIVKREGSPVEPLDVDSYLRMRSEEERIERVRSLVKEWGEQQQEERKLRKSYAKALLLVLAGELGLIFLSFFLIGLKKLEIEKWMADAFLLGALAQTTSLVLIVVKYLFPERTSDVLRLIEVATSSPTLPPDERK